MAAFSRVLSCLNSIIWVLFSCSSLWSSHIRNGYVFPIKSFNLKSRKCGSHINIRLSVGEFVVLYRVGVFGVGAHAFFIRWWFISMWLVGFWVISQLHPSTIRWCSLRSLTRVKNISSRRWLWWPAVGKNQTFWQGSLHIPSTVSCLAGQKSVICCKLPQEVSGIQLIWVTRSFYCIALSLLI